MSSKSRTPGKTPWHIVKAEDWAKGYAHVGRLMGVSRVAAFHAHRRMSIPVRPLRPRRPMPEGLQPTDSPSTVALKYGVSITTASKWLASVGRPPAKRGRPPRA